jgi:VanZ family protein
MHGLQAPNAVISPDPTNQAQFRTRTNLSEKLVFLVKIMRIAVLVLLAYWILIFVGTHIPAPTLPGLDNADKLYHFLAFAGLSFLLAWAIPSGYWPLSRNILLAATIAFGYAVIDELTQQFVPGRTCDVWDVVADSVGIVLGLTAYLAARSIVSRIPWARRLLTKTA